ncbi:MAG: alkylation response protein AidB-like acyl-CoA dehydrogenase, partial [Pseudoalteromonas tetraodonis]
MSAEQYVNRRDLLFWLFEFLDSEAISQQAPYEGTERADIEQMIDTAMQMAESEFEHLPHLLDEHEPEFDGEKVILTDEHAKAIRSYLDSGFASAGQPTEFGGMGLPNVVTKSLNIPIEGISGSAFGYVFLTNAAAYMLSIVGSEEQKAKFLPAMIEGKWFGTMALSEPQAGSSLGDIRTKAVLQADGSYHLTGSKMWISGGDHELAENIIHMVLAKVVGEDGKTVPGSRGISLFLVPKYHVNDDGSLGDRNGFKLSGINHKMGNRGTVNTVPVMGSDEGIPCV